jgi:type IV secretory pathway VirD2 relaxase
VTRPKDDLRVRPGHARRAGRDGKQSSRFLSDVVRATRKAGHTGYGRGAGGKRSGRSSFGRGRFARTARGLTGPGRRVLVKARVVRHRGVSFRSAPLVKHIAYLRREGVSHDLTEGHLFGRDSDRIDAHDFTEACEDDRHHFRFIVSPEDAAHLADFRAFTRDLMARVERDLGTRLDWAAIDHWNTDNPHLHILIRGKAEDGRDLVISRDYISRGFRARAEHLVELELGPRTAREIAHAIAAEVQAERWTGLDRALQALADDHAGIADLRPGSPEPRDKNLRRLMIGRAQVLERFGLTEQLAPAVWQLKPGAEAVLREIGDRGDIIRTMHRAQAPGPERAATDYVIEGMPETPVLGRLVERGLHDDHQGTAYSIIDGIDGRLHHLRFSDIDATGDTGPGGIVETRVWTPKEGGASRLTLTGRSDLTLTEQIGAEGATWLDRVQLTRERPVLSEAGFGGEVRTALDQRADHLVAQGLARRQGPRVIFSGNLLATLKSRELESTANRLTAQTGKSNYQPTEGEPFSGKYRQRLALASGRFALIDTSHGFALVPWSPSLDRHLGETLSGRLSPNGSVDWSIGRKRGPSR